ncbi:MAG: acyltransferase [Dokdonella sp.]|nr:acyltransferase [Dokdonella sp.]
MQTDPSSAPRMVELDALRGLAALAVVGFHYTTLYDQYYGHTGGPLPSLAFGNYGVHLFFLISGFVIFMTLERTRTALDFVVSRFSRLFPAYWVAILLSAAVVYTIGMPSQRIPWVDVMLDFTMIQDFLGGKHLDGSYWTLEVELFFYVQMLFWFVVGLLRRIRWIIVGWLLLATAYGLAMKHGEHFSYLVRELLILRYIPFFALGILFYRLRVYPSERRVDAVLIVLALVAIALAYQPVFAVVALACTAVFAAFICGWLRWLRFAPFAFLGTISYSLYLLHQAIGFSLIWQFERLGLHAGPASVLAALLVSGLAALLTFCVERPAMRRIRAWWNRHLSVPAGADAGLESSSN